MKRMWIILILVPIIGCHLTQPTYRDVPPDVLEEIATRYQTTADEMLTDDRRALKAELSDELGLEIEQLIVSRTDGQTEVTAEIEPATADAFETIMEEAPADPTSWTGWLSALFAGGAVVATAVFTRRRGRQTKKQAA